MAPTRRPRHRLLVSVASDHRWAAWSQDARVLEFHCQQDRDHDVAGNIYLGRVTRVDKGLAAAFVDLGRDKAAFLPLEDRQQPIAEGDAIIVQIERMGQGEKGPRVTASPSMIGPRLLLRPGRRGVALSQHIADKSERARLSKHVEARLDAGEGVLIRTSAAAAPVDRLDDELSFLRSRWNGVVEARKSRRPPALLCAEPAVDLRLLRDDGPGFDEIVYDSRRAAEVAVEWCRPLLPELVSRIAHRRSSQWDVTPAAILEQVQDALESRAPLPAGGSIVIEATAAMTVIDVNTETAGGAQADLSGERVMLRTNLAAAEEIARQLRLRNVGGIVVVDFIDLKDAAARRQVVERLRQAVADDTAPVWVGGMSRLGLVELTRKRRGPTLADILTQRCATCAGAGRAIGDLAGLMPKDTA